MYFGELCHGDSYEEPLVVPIDETTVKPPQLNDYLVFKHFVPSTELLLDLIIYHTSCRRTLQIL